MFKNKLFIIGLLLLVLLPFVVAQPPFPEPVQYSGTNGFLVEYPLIQYFKQGEDMNLSFHLFNISNGVTVIPNNNLECNFHIYNHSGVYTYELNGYKGNIGENEWYIFIDGNNFSDLGLYSYIFYCNSTSGRGGYVKINYEVTPSGKMTAEYNNFSFLIPVIVLIFITSLVVFSMFVTELIWLRVVLSIALSILLTTLLRFSAWFLEISNSNQVALIHTLNVFYSFGVRAMYFIVAGAMIFLVIFIINSIRERPNKKRKDSWDNWGKDEL